MAGDAVQGVGASVEQEALLGVSREAAEAEGKLDVVAPIVQREGETVEVGCFHTIPQQWGVHAQAHVPGGEAEIPLHSQATLRVGDGSVQLLAAAGARGETHGAVSCGREKHAIPP